MGQIVQGKPTIFLTGTPIMSKPEDIFGIVQITTPGYFGDWARFSKRFIQYEHGGPFGTRVVGGKNLDVLRKSVQDIVIRRTEYEVSIQLPKTIISQIDCVMDATQEKILMEIHKCQNDIEASVEKLKVNGAIPDYNQDKANQLEGKSKGLIAARQAASTDPRLFLMSNSKMMKEVFGSMVPKTYKRSQKSESILELLEDIIDSGDKVIMFTKFRTCALMLAEDIQSLLCEKVLLYTGSESDDVRDKVVDAFKNTATYNILIGTEALAEGWTKKV
jgi:SNF2 family DNA or RNA helicase